MQLHLIVLFSVQDLYPWQWHMELVIQPFIFYQCRPGMVDVSLIKVFKLNFLMIIKSELICIM